MKYTKHCLTAFMAIIISLMVWADSGELFTSVSYTHLTLPTTLTV